MHKKDDAIKANQEVVAKIDAVDKLLQRQPGRSGRGRGCAEGSRRRLPLLPQAVPRAGRGEQLGAEARFHRRLATAPRSRAPTGDAGRRRFLSGVILDDPGRPSPRRSPSSSAGAAAAPAFGSRRTNWWPAAPIDDLTDNEPTPVTIRVTRDDGYSQIVDRQVRLPGEDRSGAGRRPSPRPAPTSAAASAGMPTEQASQMPVPRRRVRSDRRRQGRPAAQPARARSRPGSRAIRSWCSSNAMRR